MIDDEGIRHYVITVAMSDMNFVQNHIYQIGRLIRDNRLPVDYWPNEIRCDPYERDHYSIWDNRRLSHVQRVMSPEYYRTVFALYQRWDRVGRRQNQKECKEFLDLEKQWKECWKIEKEVKNGV